MNKKFDINRTKIKGSCQSGRKVVTHDSKSDFPPDFTLKYDFRQCDEVMFWIKDKEALVTTEEFGDDLEHVEVLQRKFEEFQKD